MDSFQDALKKPIAPKKAFIAGLLSLLVIAGGVLAIRANSKAASPGPILCGGVTCGVVASFSLPSMGASCNLNGKANYGGQNCDSAAGYQILGGPSDPNVWMVADGKAGSIPTFDYSDPYNNAAIFDGDAYTFNYGADDAATVSIGGSQVASRNTCQCGINDVTKPGCGGGWRDYGQGTVSSNRSVNINVYNACKPDSNMGSSCTVGSSCGTWGAGDVAVSVPAATYCYSANHPSARGVNYIPVSSGKCAAQGCQISAVTNTNPSANGGTATISFTVDGTDTSWNISGGTTNPQSGTGSGSKTVTTGPLTSDAVYTISCGGNNVPVAITVPPPVSAALCTIDSFTASPASISAGGASTLTWNTSNAVSCTATWNGQSVPVDSSAIVSPGSTTDYKLECKNADAVPCSNTITVSVAQAPQCPTADTFTVNGGSAIAAIQGTQLNYAWSSTNADSVSFSGASCDPKILPTNTAVDGTQTLTMPVEMNGKSCDVVFTAKKTGCSDSFKSVTVSGPNETGYITATPSSGSGSFSGTVNGYANVDWRIEAGTTAGGFSLLGTGVAEKTYSQTVSWLSAGLILRIVSQMTGNVIASTTITSAPSTILPTCSFAVLPTSGTGTVTPKASWSSKDAQYCTALNGWTGTQPISGSNVSLAPITATKQYGLSCTNAVGTTQCTGSPATVTVSATTQPACSISVSPASATTGAIPVVTWSSTNAGICNASGGSTGWSGSKAISGSWTAPGVVYSTSQYSLTCSNSSGAQASCSATMTIASQGSGLSCSASPASISVGGTTTFSATGAGAGATYSWSISDGSNLYSKTGSSVTSPSYGAPGTFPATVSSPGYTSGSCTVNVTSGSTATDLKISSDKFAYTTGSGFADSLTVATNTSVYQQVLVSKVGFFLLKVYCSEKDTGSNYVYGVSSYASAPKYFYGWPNACSYSTPGTYTMRTEVQQGAPTGDPSSMPVDYDYAVVTVAAPTTAPTCSLVTANPTTNSDVVMTASGGDGTFAWSGGETPATGTGTTFTTKWGTSGTKTVTVTSAGKTGTCTVNLASNLQCQLISGSLTGTAPLSVGLGAVNGTGSTYSWSDNGTTISGQTASTASLTLVAGTHNVTVTRGTDTASCPTIVVSTPPTLSCTASPTSGNSPLAVSYQSQNGSGSTYQWTVDGVVASETGTSLQRTYTTNKTYSVSVTNQSVTAACPDVTVSATPITGACGSSNGGSFTSAPTTNLCSSGNASAVSGSGPWTWTCTGTTGSPASCSASVTAVPGACGSSNGGSFTSAPSTNLCSSGTASAVSGSGPWTWTCTGTTGSPASCSAQKTVVPPPSCTMTASKTLITIPPPQQVTMAISCSNITSCTMTATDANGNSSTVNIGTATSWSPSSAPTLSTTYTLNCVGPSGTTSATASVRVINLDIRENP